MTMTMNPWIKLWELATEYQATPATIEVDPQDPGRAVLVYEDGSRQGCTWDDGGWQPDEDVPSSARAE